MDQSSQPHPSEEALERFCLEQCREEDLEMVETHALCCEFCVERLERLDLEIEVTKRALSSAQRQREPQRDSCLRDWDLQRFNPSRVFWATVLAACTVCVELWIIPNRVALTVTRGSETSIVSSWRPIDLQLDVKGLDQGPVTIEILDGWGAPTWQGKASVVDQEDLNIRVPRLMERGIYFVRICAGVPCSSAQNVVREFVLRAQSPL